MNAKQAVKESRAAGFLQTLCLGKPVPEIRLEIDESRLWVSGAHVCPRYLGGEAENRLLKRTDSVGTTWHNMGDRVKSDEQKRLWYAGRSGQSFEEFRLEQEVYSVLGHTSAFLQRDPHGKLWLIGEQVVAREAAIRKTYPEIHYIEDAAIIRDNRHRARIDRRASLKKGAPWLVG
jgi:acyl-CoA synthetase (AMP-forming)/AMP-acid ligase II